MLRGIFSLVHFSHSNGALTGFFVEQNELTFLVGF